VLHLYNTISVKRVYTASDKSDGQRILVDRLWPRGLSKEKAKIDLWLKEIAPTTELRQWYEHDPVKWPKFKIKYFDELNENKSNVDKILAEIKVRNVTLLYSSKEQKLNNAVALKEYLETIISTQTS
jgi:uncharacterized protein YeaO (DUF488 family)